MAETASTPAVKEICQYIYYMLDEMAMLRSSSQVNNREE